ncbi:MAG: glutamine amidotransferase, partial [Myxococcaceae bacterium]
VRNAVSVELELHARGLRGRDVPVVLQREGLTIGTRTVHVDQNDQRTQVSFTFTPDQTGRFVYTVGAPVFPGEAVVENNSRSFVLKVIRDRVRVLLVVGRPSWDERFLRGLLRQDPNVDLVSFYILRTSSDDTQTRNAERELSLIPFPMEEIFDTKLHTFDVVVFQNFGYAEPALSIASYERNLEQYVSGGGALLVIGGDHAFGEGRAAYPVLDRALPVDPSGTPAVVEPFKIKLTPEGLRNPVMRVQTAESGTQTSWDELPPASGLNIVRVKQGATVLLAHPTLKVDGQPAPVLALWDHGRGRAMAMMTDDSWTWAFTARRTGEQNRHYDRFWTNALRWLVRDPDLTTLQISADPPTVEPGHPVGAVVTARQPDYQAAASAEVRVDLFSLAERKVLQSRVVSAGPDGVARVTFDPVPPGAYKLRATAKLNGKELGVADDAVAVRSVGPEMADASVRTELLADVARATGGRAYELPMGGFPDAPLLDPPLIEVGRSKDAPLWDRWGWLVALAVLLGAEWFLRRRFGYI